MARRRKRAKGRGPNPVLGMALLVAAAAGAVLLFLLHWQSRPLNLRDYSDAFAGVVEQLLLDQFVPRENIRRVGPAARSDDGAAWHYYEFDVQAPAALRRDAVERTLRDALLTRYSGVVDVTAAARENTLALTVAGRVFADVTLRGGEPAPAAPRTDLRAACRRIAAETEQVLVELGVPSDAIAWSAAEDREDAETRWVFTGLDAPLPVQQTPASVEKVLAERMRPRDVRVTSAPHAHGVLIALAYAGKPCVALLVRPNAVSPPDAAAPPAVDAPAEAAPAPQPAVVTETVTTAAPRIAVILDDGGYSLEVAESVLTLDPRLTLSILPSTPHGTETALRAAAMGFEVMLHMPMEAEDNGTHAFPGQLEVAADPQTLRDRTLAALAHTPGAKGVNNHTGSRFTRDATGMRVFLEVLRERGLYFIDSRTHPASVGLELARNLGVPSAGRDIFLDNDEAPAQILAQFEQLLALAEARGQAIGIGHFRQETVDVLRDVLPGLGARGIELVPASALLR